MLKSAIILILLFLSSIIVAQDNQKPFDLKSVVKDKNTGEVLPFANAFNKNTSNSTASNSDGYFLLPDNQIGDTVFISYIGYEEKAIIISETQIPIIYLSPVSVLISDIVITANSDFLYKVVGKLKRNRATKNKDSKTYYFLETLKDDETTEIIESYYNGTYADMGISTLKIKKGRVVVKPIDFRFFNSTGTSRTFTMHDIFSEESHFPQNPLHMSRREMKQKYKLKLINRYEQNSSINFVVAFSPIDTTEDLFRGKLWINLSENKLIKVFLELSESKTHPFLPIGLDTIQSVDMEITKTYQNINSVQYVDGIDFNYSILFNRASSESYKVKTKAFIKAYDYSSNFELPKFEFTQHRHKDYRDMTIVPYDSTFWNYNKEFRFYDQIDEIDHFVRNNKVQEMVSQFTSADSSKSQLEFPYIRWRQTRIILSQPSEKSITNSDKANSYDIDRYNFNVKLYLDMNYVQDSFTYQLYAIFDPIGTYYNFHVGQSDIAFANMYFDLLEIQKRKMEEEISNLNIINRQVLESLHKKHLTEFEKTIDMFISKSNRGRNKGNMKVWSKIIEESLGVDNYELFRLEE